MSAMTEARKAMLVRWYFQARRNPDSPASKKFIRTQADFGQYPPIQRRCADIMAQRERAMFASSPVQA